MRIATLTAAVSALALTAVAAQAQDAATNDAAPAAAVATPSADAAITDAELASFAAAMQRMQAVTAQVQNGTPTAEQQSEMADAVEASGLAISRFNAISGAVSNDPVVRARIAVATAPESPAGSVGAGVTDEEAAKFAQAVSAVRAVSETVTDPTAQRTQMAAAIETAGLDLERFNAISAATSSDSRLRARIALEQVKGGA